jgi:hypothetical protein
VRLSKATHRFRKPSQVASAPNAVRTKHGLDAVLIVGLLQALQGDEKRAELLLERGYGKVPDTRSNIIRYSKTLHVVGRQVSHFRQLPLQRAFFFRKAS